MYARNRCSQKLYDKDLFFFFPIKAVAESIFNTAKHRFCFVKIILKKNDNFDLTLRKRLFCNAKPTLLPCKTAAFAMQNNRFCNALIER